VARQQQVSFYGCCFTDDLVPISDGLEHIVAISIISLECYPLFTVLYLRVMHLGLGNTSISVIKPFKGKIGHGISGNFTAAAY
jgi:hypothetical protein